ncbi:MAG: pseudaminic acid synthase [bacterium]|nr:pseudaminic acid synthase [bacterium]
MKRIKLDSNHFISAKDPCFVIAEMSANHAQDLSLAKKIVRVAAKSGANAIKLQTYLPETMTLNSAKPYFIVKHHKWGGQSLYDLYKKAYTPWSWHKELQKIAKDEGLVFFSTPFDHTAVDLLEDMKVPIYKVASYELTDLPLIKYIAQTGKPVIMSTGMATKAEIWAAVNTAIKYGSRGVVLLKCSTSYPADPQDINLRTIADMQKTFKVPVGFSDHTMGVGVSVAAVALGACVIEKHITLSRKIKSADSFFSIEPEEFRELVNNIRLAEKASGKVSYALSKEEKTGRLYRRSIFVSRDINKGDIFTTGNIQVIRPAHGLEPKYWEKVIGKKAARHITAGTPLRREMVR